MTGYLIDPDDRTQAIHTPTARLAGRVFCAPVGTDPAEMVKPENFIGFTHLDLHGEPGFIS